MTHIYTQKLEEIVREMRSDISGNISIIPNTEYLLWLDFLKKINPDSSLLEDDTTDAKPTILADEQVTLESAAYLFKECSNITELMILAETKQYPTWFIQPKFNDPMVTLVYENGELQNIFSKDGDSVGVLEISEIGGVPKFATDFTGRIVGIALEQEGSGHSFVACDADNGTTFLQKMEFLERVGFKTADYISFPTNKIPSISGSKLEACLHNYLSTISPVYGLKVEGIIIISDLPIFTEENSHINRIFYKHNNQPISINQ